jgi:hypothetical protein
MAAIPREQMGSWPVVVQFREKHREVSSLLGAKLSVLYVSTRTVLLVG